MMTKEVEVLAQPDVGKSRLMGANLFFPEPGAVLDATLNSTDMQDAQKIIDIWYKELNRIMTALNWSGYKAEHKKYSRGIKFAISAPADLLYVGAFTLVEVWDSVYTEFKSGKPKDIQEIMDELQPDLRRHLDLKFRAIYSEARRRSLNVFLERYDLCIGSGKYAFRCDIDDIRLHEIPWDDIKDVPTVIVTGTNGKTTTVRLTAYIVKNAKRKVGYCSTDWVVVGDEIVEKGDMSGPTGNLRVMTNPDVEIAILEAARGGLVRRGLITDFACAATVTNVSEDHLGQDGVETVSDLAYVKTLLYEAVKPDGFKIVNIDDAELARRVPTLKGKKILITQRDLSTPEVAELVKHATYVCHTKDGGFYWKDGDKDTLVATFKETPITVDGFAKHNVENTMQAISLSYSLGLSLEEIKSGITTYENTVANNHGRANVFKHNGGTIIVDFAHNPAAIGAILNMSKAYLKDSGKYSMLVGNTGNRLNMNDSICQQIADANLDEIMIKEIPNYLRGAKLGQIPKMIEDTLLNKGVSKDKINMIESEENALEYVLETMKAGDVCAFLCHSNTGEILKQLEERTKK